MQQHQKVLAELSERLDEISREIAEIKSVIDRERDRVSSMPLSSMTPEEFPIRKPSVSVDSDDTPLSQSDRPRFEEHDTTPPFILDNVQESSLDDFEAIAPEDGTSTIRTTEEESRKLLEPLLDFDLLGSISLADTFFFANELFLGNKVRLEESLREIEKMSSMTQVENYLYDVCLFSHDDEAVQRLIDFILSHANTRK